MSQVTGKDLGFSQGASFYEKLAPAERDEMQYSGMLRRYKRGAWLSSEGDPANFVTILLDGWAKAVTTTTAGAPVLLRLYGPGDLIGGEAVISGQVSPESVIALAQVRCLRIRADRFDNLLARNRGIDLGFRDAMAQRVLAADQQVRDRLSPADVRLARLLTDLARRSGIEAPQGVRIPIHLSQEDLASWIGVSRAAVARILRGLRDRGVVLTGYRYIIITDFQEVYKIARER